MPLVTGSRIGSYQVLDAIGAGGMGEVYRARDVRLQRDVALKVLPDPVARDADRLARFAREAQLLAALNHPNIAVIHGVEESDGIRALVLELVDGPTLEEVLRRGPLPLDDTLRLAEQLADALRAAHASGIIHRDLKPSNIKLRHDGTLKVLDFGLARALEPASGTNGPTDLSTMTSPAATQEGVVLGTAPYMSPEQARGQTVDRRTDIWAFGCVVYEMLTGRRAFEGRDTTETLAFIVTREPDWEALPAGTPAALRRLLRRTLQKDQTRRLADIADARLDLDEARDEPAPAGAAPARANRERLLWVTALTIVALSALAAWLWKPAAPAVVETRVDVVTPPTPDSPSMAISPDGRQIVFVASSNGRSQLWLRSFDRESAEPLAGTENARLPFWSPDSQSIGFGADAQLKRLDLDGRAIRRLAHAPVFLGGTWSRQGVILFVADANTPVVQIPDTGGDPVRVTALAPGEITHYAPHFLPDGRRFLYHVFQGPAGRSVHVGELGHEATRRLLDADAAAQYIDPGHLLFVRGATAFVQRVDPGTLDRIGEPAAVAARVGVAPFAASLGAAISVSAGGEVAYRTGSADAPMMQFAWMDRQGTVLETIGEPTPAMLNPALSPDERRVAMFLGGTADIWTLDLQQKTPRRFTITPGVDFAAIWSPDGSRLVLSTTTTVNSAFDLFLKPASGAGPEEALLTSDRNKLATDWSRDGQYILYQSFDPARAFDIWALRLKDRSTFPVVQTDADERNAQFSPDGRWIAYQSNESGRFEIWLQAFDPSGESSSRWQLTSTGGVHARWNDKGTELFYLEPDGRLVALPLHAAADGASLEPGPPTPLFAAPGLAFAMQGTLLPPYAVARDGRFFVLSLPPSTNTAPINLVLNWNRP